MKEVMAFLGPFARSGAALVDDSRAVRQGDVFVARTGTTDDGTSYVKDALGQGASAVLHEKDIAWDSEWNVPHHGKDNLAGDLGGIADLYYGSPSSRLQVVVVTGTKGKTTTAYWCAQLLGSTKAPCGYVGTVGTGVIGNESEGLAKTGLTTPGVVELHSLLAGFARAGCKFAVIEASSHGIAQGRLDGVDCDVAVFTNLGQDHLDYHKTKEDYLSAKAMLFAREELDSVVVNADDKHAERIIASSAARDVVRCGQGDGNDIGWNAGPSEANDNEACFVSDGDKIKCTMPAPGAHNVANLALAIGAAQRSGMQLPEIAEKTRSLKNLPGRMERIDKGGITAYVDFAHTPEALEAALVALRGQHPGASLTCVFGCGGNRDSEKRPLMGKVAARLADKVMVTSDNPRDEDPGQIASQVAEGASGKATVILDRGEAIARAVAEAKKDEVLLVAGKGDETQIVSAGGSTRPFSDAQHLIDEMGGRK